MNRWSFGIDNDELINLVLSGKKTATTSPYDENEIPVIGEESIIVFDDNKDACIVKTKEYYVMKFNEMIEPLARLEGEGDLSLKYWRDTHLNYFRSFDPNFNDNSKIMFEIFELKTNLVEKNEVNKL